MRRDLRLSRDRPCLRTGSVAVTGSCGRPPRWCGGSSPGFAPERRRGRPVPADKAEAVDTGAVLPGPFLRPDRRGPGGQAGDHSQRRLRDSAQAGLWLEAGDSGLGGAQRPVGRLAAPAASWDCSREVCVAVRLLPGFLRTGRLSEFQPTFSSCYHLPVEITGKWPAGGEA